MKKIISTFIGSLLLITTAFAGSISELQSSLHQIADKESKSVVYISTEKTIKQRVPYFDPFEFFFNNRGGNNGTQPQEREFKQSALGSGVIYSKKGDEYFIITNNHVVDGADTVKISINEKKQYDAVIVGGDPDVDIAVIKVKTKDSLQTARIGNSDKLKVADLVVAIGNPFGLSHSVTFGIVSALGRPSLDYTKPGFTNFIQTDTAINPGNSGGPLLNIGGEVVGINTMIYSQSGGSIGIGFAIPINIAVNIADQLITSGKIEHGWIGITFQELDKERLEKLGIKNSQAGMLVLQVEKDGPADKAGIKAGDVFTRINNRDLMKSSDLTIIIGNTKPGDKVPVTILRDGSTLMKYITVGKRSTKSAGSQTEKEEETNQQNKYGLSLSETKDGVVVQNVAMNSIASRAGIMKGDLIYKVNSRKIKNLKDFIEETKNSEPGSGTYFFINRNGDSIIIMM